MSSHPSKQHAGDPERHHAGWALTGSRYRFHGVLGRRDHRVDSDTSSPVTDAYTW
jgi:hypothetical protein